MASGKCNYTLREKESEKDKQGLSPIMRKVWLCRHPERVTETQRSAETVFWGPMSYKHCMSNIFSDIYIYQYTAYGYKFLRLTYSAVGSSYNKFKHSNSPFLLTV